MKDSKFGEYLRELRKKQDPPMTQESLAIGIGRGKMTISQFEIGKNTPPEGELLEKIIEVLELSDEEESKLRFLASESRKKVPSDIEKYFFENPSICDAIRAAKDNSEGNEFWHKLTEQIGKSDE